MRIVFFAALVSIFSLKLNAQVEGDTKINEPSTYQKKHPDIKSVGQSVNLFSGNVSFNYPLVELKGKSGLDINVALSYSSNIESSIGRDNKQKPTGWLGLGWNLDFGKITADRASSGLLDDDSYYLESPVGTGALFSTNSTFDSDGESFKRYKIDGDRFTKIGVSSDQSKWIVVTSDGMKYVFSTKSYSRCFGNWIGPVSPNSDLTSFEVAYQWQLSYIENPFGDRTLFEYDQINEGIFSESRSYTKASYLKRIIDSFGRTISFTLLDKNNNEFVDPHIESNEPDAYQEMFESKYLSEVTVKNESGTQLYRYVLTYNVDQFTGTGVYQKRQLTSIQQFDRGNIGQPADVFVYNSSEPNTGALNKIKYGNGSEVVYSYTSVAATMTQLELVFNFPSYCTDKQRWRIHTGQNYVVFANHDDSDDSVRVWAYYWTGKWIGGRLAAYKSRNVKWDLLNDGLDKNNEVVLSRDFFVVHINSQDGGSGDDGDNSKIYIWYWDATQQQWKNSFGNIALKKETTYADYDLAVGDYYVAFLHKAYDGELTRFTFFQKQWSLYETEIGNGNDNIDYLLYEHRNYYILRNDDYSPDGLQRFWIDNATGQWKNSALLIPSTNYYWCALEKPKVICGDFFITVIDNCSSARFFTWDKSNGDWKKVPSSDSLAAESLVNYGYDKDYVTGTAFGNLLILQEVKPQTKKGKLYAISGYDNGVFGGAKVDYFEQMGGYTGSYFFGLGNEYVSEGLVDTVRNRLIEWNSSSGTFRTAIRPFDPTTVVGGGNGFSSISNDYDTFTLTNYDQTQARIYRRLQAGSEWSYYEVPQIGNISDRFCLVSGDFAFAFNLDLLPNPDDAVYAKVYHFRNNMWSELGGVSYVCGDGRNNRSAVTSSQFWGYLRRQSYSWLPGGIRMYRYNDKLISGNPSRFACTSVSINDGFNNTNTYQFSYENGKQEPSGNIHQYNKVTVTYPDNNGKTETYFFNDIPNSELNNSFPSESNNSNMSDMHRFFNGSTYKVKSYEYVSGSYSLIKEIVNYYKATQFDLELDLYSSVIVQNDVSSIRNNQSSVIRKQYFYDPTNTVPGPIQTSVVINNVSPIRNSFAHYAAQGTGALADAMRAANILTAADQTYTVKDGVYESYNWTIFESRTINNKSVYVPVKSRTYLSSSSMTTAPAYNELYPGSDVVYDSKGNVIETKNTNGVISSSLYLANTLAIAQFENTPQMTGGKWNILADEFGDGSISDNSPFGWSSQSGSWSVGVAGASKGELITGGSGAHILNTTVPMNLVNFVAECDITIKDDFGGNNNYAGIEFRKTSQTHTSDQSGYRVTFSSGGMIGVYKNGMLLQETQSGVTSRKLRLKLQAQGSLLKVYVDGKILISVTDATYSGDYFGLCAFNSKSHFDNVVIYPIGASYSIQSYDPATFDVAYKMDGNGQKMSYEYDSLGRLVRVRGSRGEIMSEKVYKYSIEQ